MRVCRMGAVRTWLLVPAKSAAAAPASAGGGVGGAPEQLVHDAGAVPAGDPAVARVEVLSQLVVILQPPHGGGGEDQIARAAGAERLEVLDGAAAVGGVVAGVGAGVGAGEVPALHPVELRQLLVALAHDEHDRPRQRDARDE